MLTVGDLGTADDVLGSGFPRGYEVLTVPPKAIVVSCDSTVAVACPGLSTAPVPGVSYYYLFKHGSFPGDPESPYPQMTGKNLELSGTQADVDPTKLSTVGQAFDIVAELVGV